MHEDQHARFDTVKRLQPGKNELNLIAILLHRKRLAAWHGRIVGNALAIDRDDVPAQIIRPMR